MKLQSSYGSSLNDKNLSHKVLGCAFKVHTELGPSMLERIYRACTAYGLRKLGLVAVEEHPVRVIYDNTLIFEYGLRIDILVENRFVLELKVVENLIAKHTAQTLSYMRFVDVKRGLLLHFTEASLYPKGIKRLILPDRYLNTRDKEV